jgi:hypothetical protein
MGAESQIAQRFGALMVKMTAIVPKKLLDSFRPALQKALTETGKGIEKDFQRTTKTWQNKPAFTQEDHLSGDPMSTEVYTEDEVYGYVNSGTKPHVIRPKTPGGRLAFQGTYTAKTSPGVIDAKGGGKSGAMVYSQGVQHPGTDAREFDKAIAKEWEKKFPDAVDEALKQAAKSSGHGM